MATINVRDNQQVIDYLARDYSSFRKALLDLIPAKLPEWTDRSEADFGVVLIELLAYMGDILSYYQDRIANEAFLSTAQERRSVIEHLRLIGYEMPGAAPAIAFLSVIVPNTFTQTVEVRKGEQFATASSKERRALTFEYVERKPLVIDFSKVNPDTALKDDGTPLLGFREAVARVPVREGKTIVREVVGVSDGTPNQRFALQQPRVQIDSLEVVVQTTPPTPPWRLRRTLVFSPPAFTPEQLAALDYQDRIGSTLGFSRKPDPDFATQTDENDVTTLLFGDGQYGQIPPVGATIVATYRTGGGVIGNVGSGQINVIAKALSLQLAGAKVVNRKPASGGAEPESIQHAVFFAPTVFTSMNRAVTSGDYVSLANLFPGVLKARVEVTNWNAIKLYVAPTGDGQPPSDILKRDLLTYFEDRRMLTTFLEVLNPDYVFLAISVQIGAKPFLRNEDVQNDAATAIKNLFDFNKANFGETMYLSKVYEVLEGLTGVDNVFVRRFSRLGDPNPIPADGRIVLGPNEIRVLRQAHVNLNVTGGV